MIASFRTLILAIFSAALAVIILMALAGYGRVSAHDIWINRGAFQNGAGEWCCGEGDCAVIDGSAVHTTPTGYVIRGYGTLSFSDPNKREREWISDTIPYSEAQPSPDGAYWRCKRPDGSRRCFFAPPPGS